jgi:hypothetical protein
MQEYPWRLRIPAEDERGLSFRWITAWSSARVTSSRLTAAQHSSHVGPARRTPAEPAPSRLGQAGGLDVEVLPALCTWIVWAGARGRPPHLVSGSP